MCLAGRDGKVNLGSKHGILVLNVLIRKVSLLSTVVDFPPYPPIPVKAAAKGTARV